MPVRWTSPAAEALERIADYIAQDNPQAAHRVVNTIYDRAQELEDFPFLGRVGRIEGTRELPVSGIPYLVIYRIVDDTVEIVSVFHTSRRFPPEL